MLYLHTLCMYFFYVNELNPFVFWSVAYIFFGQFIFIQQRLTYFIIVYFILLKFKKQLCIIAYETYSKKVVRSRINEAIIGLIVVRNGLLAPHSD